ncbi:MAG: hypothetical protein LBM69_04670 [Lachnospiraceae bacterium]|nr:hypothetical protein [Lachnospiraceae bacterium]
MNQSYMPNQNANPNPTQYAHSTNPAQYAHSTDPTQYAYSNPYPNSYQTPYETSGVQPNPSGLNNTQIVSSPADEIPEL